MSIKILWQYENTYVDFSIDGVSGIFRVANSDGVDLEASVAHIMENVNFFQYAAEVGIAKVFEESKTVENWGNGWTWQETKHPKQAKGFRLDSATSWYSRPFGQALSAVKTMQTLHNIEDSGIKLLRSWNPNRQPGMVCYFFASKEAVVCAA